ncbi:YafY family protein [Streptomyces sp. B3I8]|uniref:helix-turn-helix transcriptional regulator n=1 Tax=Streptomyces sp. B3I8 TaxID=3042303 RepID=UPI00277D92EC|nr:WYL domain-containing protein [Streptomyces sp. B3I8]MDQ0785343.1 putative DNA-binding transcriptional regulator YafY [Streptomyces sp. B3I8]
MQKTSSRLLALLSLLQTRRHRSGWSDSAGRPDWSGDELAERLAVTPRTVRRDIGRLRELGYPVTTVKGPAGGYRLDAGTRVPPLLFDDDQAVALAVALHTAAEGTAVAEDAARALTVLGQVLPSRLRHRIDVLRGTVAAPARRAGTTAPDPRTVWELSRAVHAREQLRFDHAGEPGTAATTPRRVEPHHLATRHGRWYLVAWDLDRADWRIFRVDRIRPRTPTGPRFVPRELPARNVSDFLTGRLRGTDGTTPDWPCRGEAVLGRPAAEVAPFAGDGLVEELGPDRCRLTTGSWSWTALAAALGRFDTTIEDVGPAELRTACARLATRYAAAANGGAGAGAGSRAGAD